jgi:hypothetical protein
MRARPVPGYDVAGSRVGSRLTAPVRLWATARTVGTISCVRGFLLDMLNAVIVAWLVPGVASSRSGFGRPAAGVVRLLAKVDPALRDRVR